MGRKLETATALYLEGIRDGRYREVVSRYATEDFREHSTGVKDGHEGFIEFFEEFTQRNPRRDIRIVRGFEDGPYVFLQAYQSLNDGESQWVTMDIFATDDDDRVTEHWDVISSYVPRTPSGRSSTDGPSQVRDHGQTEANKATVRRLIEEVLVPGADGSRIEGLVSPRQLAQHSSRLGDGLEAFRRLTTGAARRLAYEDLALLVGRGDFVATLCRTRWDGTPEAQMDLFRLEDGLVVERWENAEPLPSPEELVNSGKF